jgi:enamine deaminase RidA (YjgF/YER057c/UK114 family)
VKILTPNGKRDEALTYSPGIVVGGGGRTTYVSGQIGADAEGNVSADFETQVRQVWRNIAAVLAEADMTTDDIVKLTTFLIDPADFPIASRVRTQVLREHKPASTLVYVSGLVKPEWRVEIEAVAVFGG